MSCSSNRVRAESQSEADDLGASAIQSAVFDPDFKLESNNSNEIYLEVNTEAFARALKSASVSCHAATRLAPPWPTQLTPLALCLQGSTEVSLKLTKKCGEGQSQTGKGARPCLTLTIKGASRFGRLVEITHDVGVKVKKAADMEAMKEPLCPVPDVSVTPPGPLKSKC